MNNPYLDYYNDVINTLPNCGASANDTARVANESLLISLQERDRCIKKFAWAIPTEEVCREISALGDIVEMGAGLGYWARCIEDVGGNILAYDKYVPCYGSRNAYSFRYSQIHFPVVQADHWNVLPTSTANCLLLCWPCAHDAFAYEAVRLFRGSVLVYVGEYRGCTAEERFHDELDLNWVEHDILAIPQWQMMRDRVRIYKRK